MPKKRIPIVIVNDSSSGSEAEEDTQPLSTVICSEQPSANLEQLEHRPDSYIMWPLIDSDNESEHYFGSNSVTGES